MKRYFAMWLALFILFGTIILAVFVGISVLKFLGEWLPPMIFIPLVIAGGLALLAMVGINDECN